MPRPPKLLNPYASWVALFGATVQRLRVQLRPRPVVTQAELGKRIGYSGSTVSAIERGMIRPDQKFVENCERELPAAGALRAMFPFVNAEWDDWERLGRHGSRVGILPPAELAAEESHVGTGSFPEPLVDGIAEAKALALHAEASDIGAGTLETIDQKVDRYCRDYPTTSPALLAPRIQRRLHEVKRLLGGRVTLAQHRHLLVAGGWLSVLLACLQFDMGDREGAEETRDAAFQLGKEAEHQEIMAWSFELLAWFALVEGRYEETIDHSRTGLLLAPNTSAGVQLAVQEAKGWSHLGNRDEAEQAMRRGGATLARLPVPSHPEHHFVFDASKLSFYAATCYAWLGEADRAVEHANEVVTQCLAVPGTNRWPMRLAEARVDLGLIAVRREQVDEACHLGTLALASQRRAGSTIWRIAELDQALMLRHPDASEAQDFHERYLAELHAVQQGASS
jgi:tetratricopeptide (TPR) repeat protein